MRFSKLFAGLGLACAASTVGASTLTSLDWKVAGDGLVTRDSATGLYWLDVPVTQGKSLADVQAQTVAGGLYEGFQIASTLQVDTLCADAGITSRLGSPSPVNHAAINGLIALVGETTPAFVETAGFTSESFGAAGYRLAFLEGQSDQASIFSANPSTAPKSYAGFWMVSTTAPPIFAAPVPLPSAATGGAVLACTLGVTRLRRHRSRAV